MSRVIFVCGPLGSGKTTCAQGLERAGTVRLSFDIEMWHRGIETVPPPPEVSAEIEADLRARLLHLVEDDAEVVLDFSFWFCQMREDWRALLASVGIISETTHHATNLAVVLDRLADRHAVHSDDYVIGEDLAARDFNHFEAPTPDEGLLQVIRDPPRTATR